MHAPKAANGIVGDICFVIALLCLIGAIIATMPSAPSPPPPPPPPQPPTNPVINFLIAIGRKAMLLIGLGTQLEAWA